MLLHFGNEEQKKQYIPPVVRGEKIMAMAVTEPSGGSDPASTGTKARLEGDHYVVNGSKCFITNGAIADACVFLAKTGEGAKGFSVFVVEKGTEGFEPGMALGIARAAYETAVQYAKDKQLYGKPIAELQAIQFMLADMFMQTEAAKLLAYRAAWLLDQGKTGREIGKEIASAKAFSSEVARRNALTAIQIHGAYGTLPEFSLMRYLRDSLEAMSAGGTNEIMRTVIAREIIK